MTIGITPHQAISKQSPDDHFTDQILKTADLGRKLLRLKNAGVSTAKLALTPDGHLMIKQANKPGLVQKMMSRLKDMKGRRFLMGARLSGYFSPAFSRSQGSAAHAADWITARRVGMIKDEMMKGHFDINKVLHIVKDWRDELDRAFFDPDSTPDASAATADTSAKSAEAAALTESLLANPAKTTSAGTLQDNLA